MGEIPIIKPWGKSTTCSHFPGESCHILVAFFPREGRELTLHLTSEQRNTGKKNCLDVCELLYRGCTDYGEKERKIWRGQ